LEICGLYCFLRAGNWRQTTYNKKPMAAHWKLTAVQVYLVVFAILDYGIKFKLPFFFPCLAFSLVYGFDASGNQHTHWGRKTMPKILPALGAVAFIAFSIGFNIVQYPVVWDMVARTGLSPEPATSAQQKAVSQSTKPAEPVASIPSNKPAQTTTSNKSSTKTSTDSSTKRSGEEKVEADTNLPDTATYVQASPAGANQVDSAPPRTNLVAVPNNLFTDSSTQQSDQYSLVQRLPPVDEIGPQPYGRYAAEYPQSPIPIYPSTGKE
jgi:hypothetical protein